MDFFIDGTRAWHQLGKEHPRLVAAAIAYPDLVQELSGDAKQLFKTLGNPPPLNSFKPPLPPPPPKWALQVFSKSIALSKWLQSINVNLNVNTYGAMPFDNTLELTKEQITDFKRDGYIIIREAVNPKIVDNVLTEINCSLGKNEMDLNVLGPGKFPDSVTRSTSMTNLFYKSKLPTYCQLFLGRGKVEKVNYGQVALKFPQTSNLIPNVGKRKVGGKAWHIDGFGKGFHSPFTMLCGIALSPTNDSFQGNFCVHPGSHEAMQSAVKDQVKTNSDMFSGLSPGNKPDLGEPVQILLNKGDAVIAHQKLAHLGGPNFSPNIRYQVYFRIRCENHMEMLDDWLEDIYFPFVI